MSINRLYWYSCQKKQKNGPVRESNPGPLAPKARIMPLDQQAILLKVLTFKLITNNFNILFPPAFLVPVLWPNNLRVNV